MKQGSQKKRNSPYGSRVKQWAPALERRPIQNRRPEIIKLAKEKEEYFIRRVAEEFNRFLVFYGPLEGFQIVPKAMEAHELKMAQAASMGDYGLVDALGRNYLERALAYLELGRLRAWKKAEADDALRLQLIERGAPPPSSQAPDEIEINSKKIPKLAPDSLLPWD